jgi:hypothetical protein
MAFVAKQQFELNTQYIVRIPSQNKTNQRIAYFCFLPRCVSSYNKRHAKPSFDGACQPIFVAPRQGFKCHGTIST